MKHSSHAILSKTEYLLTCLKSIFGWTACNLFLIKLSTRIISDIANNSRFAQLYFLTNLSHFLPHDDSHVDVVHDVDDVELGHEDVVVLDSIHEDEDEDEDDKHFDVVEVVSHDDSHVVPHDVLELVESEHKLELVHDVSHADVDEDDDRDEHDELDGVYDDEHEVDVDERYVESLHELIPVTETNEQESVFSQL